MYGHEQNLYAETESDFVARAGTLNITVGGERFFFCERLRMAAAPVFPFCSPTSPFTRRATQGSLLKPADIRFARRSQVVIQLDMLRITVVDLQSRSTLSIEWQGQQ